MSPTRTGGESTGWRRTGPSSTTGGSSTTRPRRSWRSPNCGRPRREAPAAALRRAVGRRPGHASEEAITRWLAGQVPERPGAPAKPGRGRSAGGGGAPSRGRAPAHDAPHRNRDALQLMPIVARGRPPAPRGSRPAGLPDDDHAGRRAAWCAADAVHRHAADDTAIATILTTAHDIHRITPAFSSRRITTPP